MRIGVIQASSQSEKNSLLFENVKKYAKCATVLNFGPQKRRHAIDGGDRSET